MEFERLTRRELQTLCKKNKIPANITNVAMTQALKSLSFVEGIEEFMQPSQSENTQSSIKSPDRNEVTSPRIPPTGGRTTRRRTAVKEEPETLQLMTRTTRRSTRKTIAADDTQTPSVVQTTTRRARVNSVCRKMDSQLKECVEEEKRNSLVTPAPSGVSTRRRRGMKEESVVKREYSTRRSVRLAAKKVDVPDLKVDFFTKEGENVNMNFKESLDSVEETSEITEEKNFSQKEELEVVSAQKPYMQIGEGADNAATLDTLEGIREPENVQAEGHAHTGKEIEHEAAFEEEKVQKSEVDDQKLDGRSIDVITAVEENLEEKSEEEELEVVSAQKHGIQIGEEGDSAVTVYNLEGKGESQDVLPEENAHTDKELKQEETVQKSEVDDQKLDGRSTDVNTAVDETVELQAVSAQKCYMQIGEGDDNAATVDTLEEKNESEDVQAEGHAHTSKEIVQAAALEEETEQKFEVDDQKLEGESIYVNTAVDENLEENSEEEELEVVSAQKNYMLAIGEEGDDNVATVDNLEWKGESEVVQAEDRAYTSKKSEQAATFEEETRKKSEVDNQKLDEESINVNTSVNKNSEVNDEVEVGSVKELKTTNEHEGEDKTYGLKGETKVVKNVESQTACFVFDTEVDMDEHNGENTIHEGALDVCNLDTETETSNEITEQSDTGKEAGFEEKACDIVENFEHETGANIAANMHGDVVENELNLCKSPKSIIVEAEEHENDDAVNQVTISNEYVPTEISFAGSDSDLIVKPTCLTPYKVSATKASPMMKSLTIMSDNKENIDSGRKIILPKVSATEASPMMKRMTIMSENKVAVAKNTDGNDKKYDDVSVRKLAKMLKKKLLVANKRLKNENEDENENEEVRGGRLALKALPGNQLVDETHNN